MKKTLNSILSAVLVLACFLCLASCGDKKTGLWENATYQNDKEFGAGQTILTVEVKAEEKTVTFTINTDKTTVGAALLEHSLIEGDDGLYTVVNGITADYDVDASYWAFYINGEYAMTGLDSTEITPGTTYQLVYTK